MGLFGNLFKKEEKKCCCDIQIVEVDEEADADERAENAGSCNANDDGEKELLITVMGPGCKRCHQLHENALAAAEQLPVTPQVEYVTDPAALANAGILSTPALLVNHNVVSQGKVLKPTEIIALLK